LENSFFVFFAAHGPESIQISPLSVGYFQMLARNGYSCAYAYPVPPSEATER
jgi:hypothetical protein